MSDAMIDIVLPVSDDHNTAAIAKTVAELRKRAYANAPTCGSVRLEWMTLVQAAQTFHISKLFLSTLATRGHIHSIKGESANSHRLVHIEEILRYLGDRLRESPCMPPAVAPSDMDLERLQHNNIISDSDDSSDSQPASPSNRNPNKAALQPKWKFRLQQKTFDHAVQQMVPIESKSNVHVVLPPASLEELAERIAEEALGSHKHEQLPLIVPGSEANTITLNNSKDKEMHDACM